MNYLAPNNDSFVLEQLLVPRRVNKVHFHSFRFFLSTCTMGSTSRSRSRSPEKSRRRDSRSRTPEVKRRSTDRRSSGDRRKSRSPSRSSSRGRRRDSRSRSRDRRRRSRSPSPADVGYRIHLADIGECGKNDILVANNSVCCRELFLCELFPC